MVPALAERGDRAGCEKKPVRMRGGVVKRGAGWTYVVREWDPQTRRSRPRWVSGFDSRRAAVQARAEAVAAIASGTHVPRRNLTVAEWLDEWITAHEVTLKRSTASSYRAIIERYLKPTIGHERLQELSPTRLSIAFRHLHDHGGVRDKPLSPRTVELLQAVLRRAMNDAVTERLITVNPVVGTKRPKVVKPKHTTWTAAQCLTYLDAQPNDTLGCLFRVALATGLRRGEICALRWCDVDLETGVLHVERAVTVLGGSRTYDTPKNHERRGAAVDGDTVAALDALRRMQTQARGDTQATCPGDQDLIFVDVTGEPLTPDAVSRAFARSQRVTDLPRLTFHELRHTHATLLLRERVPVHVVAKRLGHRDPSVTLGVYADVIADDDAEAVGVFARALAGARAPR